MSSSISNPSLTEHVVGLEAGAHVVAAHFCLSLTLESACSVDIARKWTVVPGRR